GGLRTKDRVAPVADVVRGRLNALLELGEGALPLFTRDLARLLEQHGGAILVDDSRMGELSGAERFGDLLAVLGRHVDAAQLVRLQQVGVLAIRLEQIFLNSRL